ncbi:MAG: peptidylprolyl isomerase [Verrucomicrobia bacterium]|nr:peptidylprolyl isomerase [Verrucomicrobiota bacterium]
MRIIALICTVGLALGVVAVRADEPKKETKSEPTGTAKETAKVEKPSSASPGFTDPAKLTEKAPETFKAQFDTTKGKFTIEVTRSLSPNGADRFYNLVRSGYFKDVAFFRVISGFMCQFGIHGDPSVSAKWREAAISDDPVKGNNARGAITFATAGPNTRTTQLFINFGDNSNLDGMGFSPFGKVTEGMDVVDKINNEYGEGAPRGRGPHQGRIQAEGNAYLKKDFPNLDYIKSATILQADNNK